MTVYKTNDDPVSLKIGDIFSGIKCQPPYLDLVGDTGIWCDVHGRHLARYIVVEVACNSETNEAETMNLQLIESLSPAVKTVQGALCHLHSKEIPCDECSSLTAGNY
jgi:hypothetical protein